MTIAVGFVHRNGVLLCADTQHETATMKSHATKLHRCEYWDGHAAFAYAGNSAFAVAAIQKCMKRISASNKGEDPIFLAESVLETEYRRLVYRHPDRLIDPYLGYQVLLAVQRNSQETTELHASYEVSLRRVDVYEAIGIGKPLADYLIVPSLAAKSPEHEILCFATYLVSIAKEHVPGCGGMSLFSNLRNDGSIEDFEKHPMVEHLETVSGGFFMKARQLLFGHVDPRCSDEDFQRNLDHFNGVVRDLRKRWKATVEYYTPRTIPRIEPTA